MALSKIDVFPVDLRTEPDNLNSVYTADQVKDLFMKDHEHVKAFLDLLIDKFNSVEDGSSGADNIGATEILGLSGLTVQAILESLKSYVDTNDAEMQQNLDDLEALLTSLGGASSVGGSVTGLIGSTVQALLTALKNYIDTHKSSADHDGRYFTEFELTGGALDGRYYTELESDAKYTTKDEITNNRKLSVSGDFSGTLKGMEITAAEPGLSSAFNQHLVNYANVVSRRDFVRYGKIMLPDIFPKLPFDLHRDREGLIKHNFNFDSLISGTNLYVDDDQGNDTRDGLTTSTAVRTLQKALTIANGYGEVVINMMGFNGVSVLIEQGTASTTSYMTTTCPKVTIQPYNKPYMWFTRGDVRVVVAADQSTYKFSSSATKNVHDLKYPDYRGLPKELKKVSTFAECNTTKGTWYTDGSYVWVHTLDERQPDLKNDLIVSRQFSGLSFYFPNVKMIFKNIGFIVYNTASEYCQMSLRLEGNNNSEVWLSNCKIMGGYDNALYCKNMKRAYLFDCTASQCNKDGFNYHGMGGVTPYESVFEYNCHAYDTGRDMSGINNATTCHDGMTVLRVNCVGYNTSGPVLADVNGCFSYNLDCCMYDSTRDAGSTKSAFYFDNLQASKNGKAYLINCQGGGIDTFGISSDGLIDVYVKNFAGNKISNTILNYLD